MAKKIHYIKSNTKFFQAVKFHKKNFELRKNDRNYQVGDTLCMEEFEKGVYTGDGTIRIVKYVLKDCPEYGLVDGYCILGF